ncbi:quinon protein alcohol dehydrogenase-like superfamily [Stachybotrys elegans]|uniref:Quinon protein alcohol dehydrogenase-like superfamily n=1 Tax=Stachybotrys elegans TaxID=80388 RepID=A0A8K0T323_9HYPO|nr:quinon protein alcohol dehydrogenase-like superfamily [Stachybotrys elegans]
MQLSSITIKSQVNTCDEVWDVGFSHHGDRFVASGREGIAICETSSLRTIFTVSTPAQVARCHSWSSDDSKLVTGSFNESTTLSMSGTVLLWDAANGILIKSCPEKFQEPPTACEWLTYDEQSVLIATLQKPYLCEWDITSNKIRWWPETQRRAQDMFLSLDKTQIAVIDDGLCLYVYSANGQLKWKKEFDKRPINVSFAGSSDQVLVTLQDGPILLIDLASENILQRYSGTRTSCWIIRNTVGGKEGELVLGGDSEGFLHAWNKATGQRLIKVDGRHLVCNSISVHPKDPHTILSCGDDGTVKLWKMNWTMGTLETLHHATPAEDIGLRKVSMKGRHNLYNFWHHYIG